MIVSPAVIQKLIHLKFSRQPYSLNSSTYHTIHWRRRVKSRQLRLQPDGLLRYNKFCGTVDSLKQKNASTMDLSQTTSVLNRFFVPSLVRVLVNNRQQFVVFASILFRPKLTYLSDFSLFIFFAKWGNVTNSTLTASGWTFTFGPIWHMTQRFWLKSTGVIRRTSSVCISHLFYNLHYNGISSANVIFKSTLTLLQWQAFMNFCVIILLNN